MDTRKFRLAGAIAIAIALPLLIAATSGGFPSRPRFQAVGVNAAAPASGNLTASGTITAATINGTTAVQINGVAVQPAIFAAKAGDTSRASTTTMTADPDLALSGLVVNATYELTGLFSVRANTNPINFKFAFDTGGTFAWSPAFAACNIVGHSAGDAAATNNRVRSSFTQHLDGWTTTGHTLTASAERWLASVHCIVRTPASFGAGTATFTLVWAQGTSDVNNLDLLRGSYLKLQRVS